jgi:hypothetical protein
MPDVARYFFSIRYRAGPGGLARDEEGDELSCLEAARAHALQVARDMIQRNRFDMIRNLFDCAFEITDERGAVVLNVPFTEAVSNDEE